MKFSYLTYKKKRLEPLHDEVVLVLIPMGAHADGDKDEEGVENDGVVPQHCHHKCKRENTKHQAHNRK